MKTLKTIITLFLCVAISGFYLTGCLGADDSNRIKKRNVSFKTRDGVMIRAIYGIPMKGLSDRVPALVLIHQYESDSSEWNMVFDWFVQHGYAVLAYDIRGHGKSEEVKDKMALLKDPKQAPLDLFAAIKWLSKRVEVAPGRIGVIGASIGGNLACVASGLKKAKTAVAISPKTQAVQSLKGDDDDFKMGSLFYIAAGEDGNRADYARELENLTDKPVKVKIYENSDSHGIELFYDDPQLKDLILDWLKENL